MVLLLVLLLVVLPLAELAVIIRVGEWLGVLDTIGLLALVSVVGVFVVRRQGIGILRRVRRELDAGRVPAAQLVDGALILVAGVLLVAPGFITDAVGLLLLLPPVRAGMRALLRRRFHARARTVEVRVRTSRPGPPSSPAPPPSLEP